MSTAKPGEAGEAGRLSRRDRAAMALALEMLRAAVAHKWLNLRDVRNVLLEGGPLCGRIAGAAKRAGNGLDANGNTVLRARLAIALRVLLRVDAGHFGAMGCRDCGVRAVPWDERDLGAGWHLPCSHDARGKRWVPARMRPLWLDAPPHAAATGDRRDDSAARAAGGSDV